MLSQEFHKIMAPRAKVLKVIWGAFLAATVFYVVIAWIMFGKGGEAGNVVDEGILSGSVLQIIAIVVALSLLGGSFLVERFRQAPSRLEAVVECVPPVSAIFPTSQAGQAPRDSGLVDIFESLSDTEKRLAGLGASYQSTLIMVWAMREAVVIVGLILAIMQASFSAILPFAVMGVATVALKVPRSAAFFERHRNLARKFS